MDESVLAPKDLDQVIITLNCAQQHHSHLLRGFRFCTSGQDPESQSRCKQHYYGIVQKQQASVVGDSWWFLVPFMVIWSHQPAVAFLVLVNGNIKCHLCRLMYHRNVGCWRLEAMSGCNLLLSLVTLCASCGIRAALSQCVMANMPAPEPILINEGGGFTGSHSPSRCMAAPFPRIDNCLFYIPHSPLSPASYPFILGLWLTLVGCFSLLLLVFTSCPVWISAVSLWSESCHGELCNRFKEKVGINERNDKLERV